MGRENATFVDRYIRIGFRLWNTNETIVFGCQKSFFCFIEV